MSSKKLDANKLLLAAAEEGDTNAIIKTVDFGADLEYKRMGVKRTPLIICCKKNDLENAKFLIERGADVNAFDEDRKTCLTYAIENTNVNMIRVLLEQPRINPNIVDGKMCSPLYLFMEKSAISFKHKCELLPFFLEKGAHLVVKYVIRGLNVVILNDVNYTANHRFSKNALLSAIRQYKDDHKYKKILKMMIKNSSEVSVQNAANCQDGATNALLETMMCESTRNTSKPTRKQFEISEMMIKKGADINHRFTQRNQVIPLFMKFCNNASVHVSVIDYIIHHADFDSTDDDIAKLEGATGDMCKVFQLNHDMKKLKNPMTVEANHDLIEMMIGKMQRSRSRSRSSSSRSRSSSSRSRSNSDKSEKKGGSRTRKRR